MTTASISSSDRSQQGLHGKLQGKIALITGGNSGISLTRGLVTLCIGGGQGIALAIEALH
jgi:acetyl-CoA acetyltransferase